MLTQPRYARAAVALCLGLFLQGAEGRGEVRGLSLTPSTLRVGMFSPGGQVRITGRVPEGSDAVIVVRGADVGEVLKRQVRLGFMWVAGGKVEVEAVPASFLVISPRSLGAILDRAEIDRKLLDERALTARMRITPPEADRPDVREAYLRLKVEDGTYGSVTGGFEISPSAGGEIAFAVDLPWPTTAPPGRYRVIVHECRDRVVVGESSGEFEVTEAGVAAGLKRLAAERGALYGVLAVGIALSVGFGLDTTLAWVRRMRRRGSKRRAAPAAREDVGVH